MLTDLYWWQHVERELLASAGPAERCGCSALALDVMQAPLCWSSSPTVWLPPLSYEDTLYTPHIDTAHVHITPTSSYYYYIESQVWMMLWSYFVMHSQYRKVHDCLAKMPTPPHIICKVLPDKIHLVTSADSRLQSDHRRMWLGQHLLGRNHKVGGAQLTVCSYILDSWGSMYPCSDFEHWPNSSLRWKHSEMQPSTASEYQYSERSAITRTTNGILHAGAEWDHVSRYLQLFN